MKTKIYLLGVILLTLSACEKLDQEIRTSMTEKQVIYNYGNVQNLAIGCYTELPEGFAWIGGAMMASATDEAEHTLETSSVQVFNNGSWSAVSNPEDVWGKYYRGIRRVNVFLSRSDSVDLEVYRVDATPSQQAIYRQRLNYIKNWKYEARFLRAFYYFELVKRFGGVPLINSRLALNDDFKSVKRNTLAECIKFITDECDSAARVLPLLPVNQSSVDMGRISKGAALALKSRVLLYAASDLFNTPATGYSKPELVSMPTNVTRTARWQAAADAALAVINLTGTGYALPAYSSVFGASSFTGTEAILVRRNGASNTFEKANISVGYDLCSSGTTPSQNMVDAYEVKVNATTSVPFDWNNPAHSVNPYNPAGTMGRDPRLAMSVVTNNSTFKGRPIECWTGGRDGAGVVLATKTGYYLKKYINEGLNLQTGQTAVHSWVLIRYAEMLLNYAEALNEAQGPVADVYAKVNLVRSRTGVAMPGLPAGLTQAQMRDRIRNERRVEFAFEDQRPWDVRRWMLGETYFNAPLRGVQITQTAPNVFTYVPTTVENRVFQPKMYLYPIPQSELMIGTSLVQNPGW